MAPSTHGRGALLLLLLLAAGRTSSAVEYTITDLGTLGVEQPRASFAIDVNDAGQVIGAADRDDGTLSLFLWDSQNGMQDLGIPVASRWRTDFKLNNAGQIAGSAPGIGGFVWTSATGVRRLFSPGGEGAGAYGINDLGVVVGVAVGSPPYLSTACLWDAEGNPQLLGLTDVGVSAGLDVNNAGQVVGWSGGWDGSGDWGRAFLWDETGGVQYLDTLGHVYSRALAINNLGEVVGDVDVGLGHGTARAFIWDSENGTRFLESQDEALGTPNDINDAGQVVGGWWLWDDGVVTDIDIQVGVPAGWHFTLRAINNSGQMVGWGWNPDNEYRGFLLTPIPEPATVALLLCGLPFALLLWLRRRAARA